MSMSHNQTNNNHLKKHLKENSHNKIRKRNCSSSSSSSLVRKYRFKKAILVGKKGGSTTPVPLWKTNTTNSPSMDTTGGGYASGLPFKDREEVSVSARKLAATLWEINDMHPSRVKKEHSNSSNIRSRGKDASFSSMMSDPCNNFDSERKKGFESDGFRKTVSGFSHQIRSGVDAYNSGNLIEKNYSENAVGAKRNLKEARSGLSTSKKLVKVLNQMCLREKQSSSVSLVLALGCELERICGLIDKLIQEERVKTNQNDIEHVVKHFVNEKAAWKKRERENIHEAVKNVAEERKVEKKLRKQTERLNKKIAIEMASVKASHLKVCEELEREKRAKEILEQICDELAKGIGEDRAQVEKLKNESVKVLEEVEKEREMLQLADVLREERVQMKLSEAKYQFEEKNDFLENLRNELEAFMRTKDKENEDVSPKCTEFNDLESYFNKICQGIQNIKKVNDSDEDDSDLQSIELDMNNVDRDYEWSYESEKYAQKDPKRVSFDKGSTGRKSLSEIIQWGSICFNKRNSSFKKKDLDINIQEGCNLSDLDTSIELLSRARIQDDKEGTPSNSASEEVGENVLLCFEGDNLKQEIEGRKSRCYLKSFDSDS